MKTILLGAPVILAVDYTEFHKASWLVNSDQDYNSKFSAFTDITTSAASSSGWTVTHSRIPKYSVKFTDDMVSSLNSRPKASSDFSTGKTTATAGSTYEFGDSIGYKGCDGYWPPGPACPTKSSVSYTFSTTPKTESSSSGCYVGLGPAGYFVNGVSLYGLSDGTTYSNKGTWQSLAPEFEGYDLDVCNGHAANGDYHHHHYPVCIQSELGDTGLSHSPIYGWVFDNYPIYGPYTGADTLAQSCWQKRDYSKTSVTGCSDGTRSCLLSDQYDYSKGVVAISDKTKYGPSLTGTVTTQSGNTISAASGIYYQDYFFNSTCTSSGPQYLDAYNGHSHDSLGYHYHITVSATGQGVFPYHIGPKYRGCLSNKYAVLLDPEGEATQGMVEMMDPDMWFDRATVGATCASSISSGQASGSSICSSSSSPA